MVDTRQFLAVKLSQHCFLDATALTMLLAIMIVGYLVPSGSELDNLTGLAHHDEQHPVLLGCLGLFFLAELILCAKLVMAVNAAGNANSWGYASMSSTSACLACMATAMMQFAVTHKYHQSLLAAATLFFSFGITKVFKLIFVFRVLQSSEKDYEQMGSSVSDGSQSDNQLKKALWGKRLLCVVWLFTVIAFLATILILLKLMSLEVPERKNSTDMLNEFMENSVRTLASCHRSPQEWLLATLVASLGGFIMAGMVGVVGGALASATEGFGAIPVVIDFIICCVESYGSIHQWNGCCLDLPHLFLKIAFAPFIVPPKFKFGCD